VQAFNASSGKEWRDKARLAEALGYSTLHLADHVIGPGPAIAATRHPVQQLAAVPAIMSAAEATNTLRVGCRVFCVDYHHPVVLVKAAATIDLLSDGRLEFGLGAGWLAGEYEAMGIAMDPPGVRIDRLAEVIGLARTLFAEGEANVTGRHVRAVGFEGAPRPARAGGPPIMVGGGGLRAAATAAGRADAYELEVGAYFTVVTDQQAQTAAGMAAMFGLSPDELLRHPNALIGSVGAICDELERRREAYGISYVTVGDSVMEAFAPVVERLAGR
jgi:alkanesulfonate monooxygenase SsuD/methylene tetrahydromethanopterin reductase-like flavin-dependent oxidoreductase (luciferase family)